MMRYLSNSSQEIASMLETLGIRDAEDLFQVLPESVKVKEPLPLPSAMTEPEIMNYFQELTRLNRIPPLAYNFIGAGTYHHFIPAVVWDVVRKPEFATAYTPYQPEISQGTLQSTFEFQTLICQLSGMDVSNASMYDGASAFAEAVLMARRIKRGKDRHVLVSRTIHPEYRAVLKTYTQHLDLVIEEIPYDTSTGTMDLEALKTSLRDDTFAVAVQSPNFFGVIEDWQAISKVLDGSSTVRIAVVIEALSLGLIRPPGEAGFDIFVGEGQSLGLPPNYGGPHLGLMATRQEYARKMPGRIAGVAYDHEGRRGFILTLVAREQHIRREKAMSNICTNQALCALAATVYLSLLGSRGLRELAELNTRRAHYLAQHLAQDLVELAFMGPFFNEFVLRGPDVADRHATLLKHNIAAGILLSRWYPELQNHLLLTVTEINTPAAIDLLIKSWRSTRMEKE